MNLDEDRMAAVATQAARRARKVLEARPDLSLEQKTKILEIAGEIAIHEVKGTHAWEPEYWEALRLVAESFEWGFKEADKEPSDQEIEDMILGRKRAS